MADSNDVKTRQAEVLALLLAPDSPARKLGDFAGLFKQLEELEQQQQDAKAREELFLSVLPAIEEAEQAVRDAENQLSKEKSTLADFAGELGKTAFEALRSGDIADGPHFTDRKALQARINELQQQKLVVSASESTGMLDKAKTQAQILKLAGQLKLEEFKIASANKALGSALLASRNLAPVRCETTEPLLKEIVTQNKAVNASIKKLEEQNSHSAKRIQDAAQQIGYSGKLTGEALRTEIATARKQMTACKRACATLHYELLTKAVACEPLVAKIPALVDLEISRDAIAVAGDHIKQIGDHLSQHARKHLSTKMLRYAAVGGSILLVLVLASMFRSSGPPENGASTASPPGDTQVDATGKASKEPKTPLPKRRLATSRPTPTDASPPTTRHQRSTIELLREMRKLELAESAARRFIQFRITNKLDKDLYQIVVLRQPPWYLELQTPAILLTNSTEYTSEGQAAMAVQYKGTRELTLKNGFKKDFEYYEQLSGLTYKEFYTLLDNYEYKLRPLCQELVCAFLAEYPDKPPQSAWDIVEAEWAKSEPTGTIAEVRSAAADRLYSLLRYGVASKLANVAWEDTLSPIEFAVREHDVVLFEKLVAWGKDPFWKPGARERLEKLAELSKGRRKDTYGFFDQNYNGIMECIRKYAEAAGK